MKAPADKSPEPQRQATAHEAPQQQDRSDAEFQFIDNRAETASLRQLQETADNSLRTQGLAQLKAMMNSSPRSGAMRSLQAMVDNSQRRAPGSQAGSDGVMVQRVEDEAVLQGEFAAESPAQLAQPSEVKPNNTGLPDNLKAGVESLSGMSMDNVKVHYNSSEPAQLNAHAYAQGTDIHVGPGQEQHLPHEAWHVVQQAQGRVKPTVQMKDGVSVNDDRGLEREADLMGGRPLPAKEQKSEKKGSDLLNVTSQSYHQKVNNSAGPAQLVIQRAALDAATILSGVPAVLAGNSLLPEEGELSLDTVLYEDKTLKGRIEEIVSTYESQFQKDESATAVSHNAQKVLAAFHTIGMVIARKLHMGQEGHKIAKALLASQKDRLIIALKTNTSEDKESNALSDTDAEAALKMADVLAGDDPVGKYVQDKTSLKKADASIRVMATELEKTPLVVFELLRKQFESRIGSLRRKDVKKGEVEAPAGYTFPLKDLYGEVSQNFFKNLLVLDVSGRPKWGDSGLEKNSAPEVWQDQARTFQVNDIDKLHDSVSQESVAGDEFDISKEQQGEKGWDLLNKRQMEYLTEVEGKEGGQEAAAKGRIISNLESTGKEIQDATELMNEGVKNLANWPITVTTKSQDMIKGDGSVIDTYKPFFSVFQKEVPISEHLPNLQTDSTVNIVEDVLGRGLDYGQERKEKDEQQIGFDSPLSLTDMPAMACINHQYELNKGANYYGDTHFVLNPAVRKRSVFSYGTDCPERRSLFLLLDDILTKVPKSLELICTGNYKAQDIEVHVYGNIDLKKDIIDFHLGDPNTLSGADVRETEKPGLKMEELPGSSPTEKLISIKEYSPDEYEELKQIWIKKQKGHEKLRELIGTLPQEDLKSHIPEINKIDEKELDLERQKPASKTAPKAAVKTDREKTCYITTACVKARGLADDCDELETLREFRDEYMLSQPYGLDLVMFYYKQAPKIVEAINQDSESAAIYEELYQVIQDCVKAILEERNLEAFTTYVNLVLNLRAQYIPEMDIPKSLLRTAYELNQAPTPV